MNAAMRNAQNGEHGQDAQSKGDRRSGPGRLLIAVYGIFAVSSSARASYQILVKFSEAPIAYVLSAFAAVVYIIATVSLARRGARAYWMSVTAVSVELLGVLVVGALSIFDAEAFPHETVWSGFGRGYGFVPLILPILGLWWLYRHRGPATRRIKETTSARRTP